MTPVRWPVEQDEELNDLVARYQEMGATLASAACSDFTERWRALATTGVFGVGQEGRRTEAIGAAVRGVAAIEGLGLGGLDPGLCYAAASQLFGIQMPIARLLAPEQHAMILPSCNPPILCHASTEETGGSDPLGCTTNAKRMADGSYILTGQKSFITAAPVADVAVVFARTCPGRSPFALSAFLVDLSLPGVEMGAAIPKTVLRGVPMGSIMFHDVRVGADRLIAAEGAGLSILNATTTWERALLQSYAFGIARRLLERTTDWCESREHFGRRMGASHQVAARLADMAMRLHRSRVLVYAISAEIDAGVNVSQLATVAAICKVSVTEDFLRLAEHATALAGVRAFVEDSSLAVDVASALAGLTYAGPNDLLRIVIARDVGLSVVS